MTKNRQIGFRVSEEIFAWIASQRELGVNISEKLEATLLSWKESGSVPESPQPPDILSDILERLSKLENLVGQSQSQPLEEAPSSCFFPWESLPVPASELKTSQQFCAVTKKDPSNLSKFREKYCRELGWCYTQKIEGKRLIYYYFKLPTH